MGRVRSLVRVCVQREQVLCGATMWIPASRSCPCACSHPSRSRGHRQTRTYPSAPDMAAEILTVCACVRAGWMERPRQACQRTCRPSSSIRTRCPSSEPSAPPPIRAPPSSIHVPSACHPRSAPSPHPCPAASAAHRRRIPPALARDLQRFVHVAGEQQNLNVFVV